MARISSLLEQEPVRPWCVHRLCDRLVEERGESGGEALLFETRRAADLLVATGRAHRENLSTVSIGHHSEDSVYWSPRSRFTELGQFGPDYESPRILHRLAARSECHGL